MTTLTFPARPAVRDITARVQEHAVESYALLNFLYHSLPHNGQPGSEQRRAMTEVKAYLERIER